MVDWSISSFSRVLWPPIAESTAFFLGAKIFYIKQTTLALLKKSKCFSLLVFNLKKGNNESGPTFSNPILVLLVKRVSLMQELYDRDSNIQVLIYIFHIFRSVKAFNWDFNWIKKFLCWVLVVHLRFKKLIKYWNNFIGKCITVNFNFPSLWY